MIKTNAILGLCIFVIQVLNVNGAENQPSCNENKAVTVVSKSTIDLFDAVEHSDFDGVQVAIGNNADVLQTKKMSHTDQTSYTPLANAIAKYYSKSTTQSNSIQLTENKKKIIELLSKKMGKNLFCLVIRETPTGPIRQEHPVLKSLLSAANREKFSGVADVVEILLKNQVFLKEIDQSDTPRKLAYNNLATIKNRAKQLEQAAVKDTDIFDAAKTLYLVDPYMYILRDYFHNSNLNNANQLSSIKKILSDIRGGLPSDKNWGVPEYLNNLQTFDLFNILSRSKDGFKIFVEQEYPARLRLLDEIQNRFGNSEQFGQILPMVKSMHDFKDETNLRDILSKGKDQFFTFVQNEYRRKLAFNDLLNKYDSSAIPQDILQKMRVDAAKQWFLADPYMRSLNDYIKYCVNFKPTTIIQDELCLVRKILADTAKGLSEQKPVNPINVVLLDNMINSSDSDLLRYLGKDEKAFKAVISSIEMNVRHNKE